MTAITLEILEKAIRDEINRPRREPPPHFVSGRVYEAALKAQQEGASSREVAYILSGMPPEMAKKLATEPAR